MSDIRSNFKQDTRIPLIDIFNNILEMTLIEHAPLKYLLIIERINNHWDNDTCASRTKPTLSNLYNFSYARRPHNRLLHIIR